MKTTLEIPGAVKRLSWKIDFAGQHTDEAMYFAQKAKSISYKTRTIGGQEYTLLCAVMIPELVCDASSPDAELFKKRFPNYVEVCDS